MRLDKIGLGFIVNECLNLHSVSHANLLRGHSRGRILLCNQQSVYLSWDYICRTLPSIWELPKGWGWVGGRIVLVLSRWITKPAITVRFDRYDNRCRYKVFWENNGAEPKITWEVRNADRNNSKLTWEGWIEVSQIKECGGN